MKRELRCSRCNESVGYEITPDETWDQPVTEIRHVDIRSCTGQRVAQ